MTTSLPQSSVIFYPDSDGQPMADNTRQFEWIVTIKEGLELLFAEDANVFVAGDLLWYPIEGDNKIRIAPDVLVALGRPKGHRGSYQQWQEAGIAPQVVFEILSPGNRLGEMAKKLAFYQRYGVEEYYLYDPDAVDLTGWLRQDATLQPIEDLQGWVSPRLGIRFELEENLLIYRPDNQRFLTFVELGQQMAQEQQQRQGVEEQLAQERQAKQDALQRAERLAERLRSLGLDPETL